MSINLSWQEDYNSWLVQIKEYVQLPVENPEPGSPLFSYKPIKQPEGEEYKLERFSAQEIQALFDYFGISINIGDNFTDKIKHLIALSGIYINQTRPPYTVNPADLEIAETALEIAPGEPEPPIVL